MPTWKSYRTHAFSEHILNPLNILQTSQRTSANLTQLPPLSPDSFCTEDQCIQFSADLLPVLVLKPHDYPYLPCPFKCGLSQAKLRVSHVSSRASGLGYHGVLSLQIDGSLSATSSVSEQQGLCNCSDIYYLLLTL